MAFPIFCTKFASLLPVLYRPFYIDKYRTVNSFVSAANHDIIVEIALKGVVFYVLIVQVSPIQIIKLTLFLQWKKIIPKDDHPFECKKWSEELKGGGRRVALCNKFREPCYTKQI